MHRKPLLHNLAEYRLFCPDEAENIERFIQFVQRTPDCFERTQEAGHVTGSAFVLSSDRSCVLLNFHAKLQKWFALGGHADGCSDVYSVAHREAIEESGLTRLQPDRLPLIPIDIDIHEIPSNTKERAHYHYDVRFVFQSESNDFVCSHESVALKWVPLKEVSQYTKESSMLRVIEKIQASL
jgi:8-oxo-dGTP pyrophosphatase MutT (NUDIX family)